VASVFSRWFGRKTRTGWPDFFGAASDFAGEDDEVFRRERAEREAVCRAFGRGVFFISAEDSKRFL